MIQTKCGFNHGTNITKLKIWKAFEQVGLILGWRRAEAAATSCRQQSGAARRGEGSGTAPNGGL